METLEHYFNGLFTLVSRYSDCAQKQPSSDQQWEINSNKPLSLVDDKSPAIELLRNSRGGLVLRIYHDCWLLTMMVINQ